MKAWSPTSCGSPDNLAAISSTRPASRNSCSNRRSELPIWTSLQNSTEVRKANPQIGVFLTNLANARPRPKLVHYVEASAVLQRHLHDLVLGAASPGRAMADAQAELLALQARFSS